MDGSWHWFDVPYIRIGKNLCGEIIGCDGGSQSRVTPENASFILGRTCDFCFCERAEIRQRAVGESVRVYLLLPVTTYSVFSQLVMLGCKDRASGVTTIGVPFGLFHLLKWNDEEKPRLYGTMGIGCDGMDVLTLPYPLLLPNIRSWNSY